VRRYLDKRLLGVGDRIHSIRAGLCGRCQTDESASIFQSLRRYHSAQRRRGSRIANDIHLFISSATQIPCPAVGADHERLDREGSSWSTPVASNLPGARWQQYRSGCITDSRWSPPSEADCCVSRRNHTPPSSLISAAHPLSLLICLTLTTAQYRARRPKKNQVA
jgi:hypothetical protein